MSRDWATEAEMEQSKATATTPETKQEILWDDESADKHGMQADSAEAQGYERYKNEKRGKRWNYRGRGTTRKYRGTRRGVYDNKQKRDLRPVGVADDQQTAESAADSMKVDSPETQVIINDRTTGQGHHEDEKKQYEMNVNGESWLVSPPVSIRVVVDDNDVLSIHFPCDLYICGKKFWSAEQAYQWCKAMCIGDSEAAEAILQAKYGTKTTPIANKYFGHVDWNKWRHQRIPIMRQLLRVKARSCKQFRDELTCTADSYIVAAISGDRYWGIDDGRGNNILGSLLMELCANLNEALSSDPEEDEKILEFLADEAFNQKDASSHEKTVLVIGDLQINNIECDNLVAGINFKKRIVPSIEQTHYFLENEDVTNYDAVVLHLLSKEALSKPKQEVTEAIIRVADVIIEKMKTPKVIIPLALYPIFSPDAEYSVKVDAINWDLYELCQGRSEISFRLNGMRMRYEECFTSQGVLTKRAQKTLTNNLADTITHQLFGRNASSQNKTNKNKGSQDPQKESETTSSRDDDIKDDVAQKSSSGRSLVKDNFIVPLPAELRFVEGEDDPLSNLFYCDIFVFGSMFWSSEQAYQWRRAMYFGSEEVANEIYSARYATEAALIGEHHFQKADVSKWYPQQIPVMRQILRAKARNCRLFKKELRDTGNGYIVAVMKGDNYWSIGDGSGKNVLGNLLMELRSNLNEALTADPDEDGRMLDFARDEPSSVDKSSTTKASILMIGNSQLHGISCKNLIPGVNFHTITTPSTEVAHTFIKNEDLSTYDAVVLHLLSPEAVSKPKDEILTSLQNFTEDITKKMRSPCVIISLAIYPIFSPDEEYSRNANAINNELLERSESDNGVSYRSNGLRLTYDDCFTSDGMLSKKAEELLKKNLADTVHYHLFGRRANRQNNKPVYRRSIHNKQSRSLYR